MHHTSMPVTDRAVARAYSIGPDTHPLMLPTTSPRRTPYQRLAESAIERSGLLGLLERMDTPSAARLLPILLLHRIEDPAACGDVRSPDLISATPAVFATQMEFLARKFNPIRVADLLAALDGAPLPRGRCC